MPGNADATCRRRGRGGRLSLALIATTVTAALAAAGGCSLSGSGTVDGVPHADALAITRTGTDPLSPLSTPAGSSGLASQASSAARSAPARSTGPRSSHPAAGHSTAGPSRSRHGATTTPHSHGPGSARPVPQPAPPSTPSIRVQPNPSGPVGISGDGGVVAAINGYRARSGLAPISGAFWQPAQNCAIKNLPTFTSHCLPNGMAGEVYAGMYSQSGSTAAGLWYDEGPGGEHYRIMMSSRVTRAYYGWAYDPGTGFYDVIVDFYTDGHSGI